MDLTNLNVRAFTANSENDKNVYGQLSLFRNPKMREGKITFSVFSKEKRGGPIFEAVFDRAWAAATHLHWGDILKECTAGDKVTANFTKTERDQSGQRKTIKLGSLTYGIDQGMTPYLGVQCNDGAFKFPLRPGFNYAYANDPDPVVQARTCAGAFLSALRDLEQINAQAMMVPAEQQQGGGGGFRGGNRGGGGGGFRNNNNNSGGGSSGGGEGELF